MEYQSFTCIYNKIEPFNKGCIPLTTYAWESNRLYFPETHVDNAQVWHLA